MVTALVTVLIFLVMITLHEFGHFIMAKAVGVTVLEFSIGMGPAIFKRQGKNTLYSIRIFPVGGYCKLEGEDGESDDAGAFCNQKLWKRFLVVSAGAILNLLLGFILFIVIVYSTSPFSSNIIANVDNRSYLAKTGVQSGDEIIAIDGHRVDFYNDLTLYTADFEKDKKFTLTVKRGNEKYDFVLLPSLDKTTVSYFEDHAEYVDIINGQTTTRTIEYSPQDIPESYISNTYSTERYIVGFEPLQKEVTPFNVIPQAWYYTKFIAKSIYRALGEMVTGKAGLDNVSGPVGVAGVVNEAVNSGKDRIINILFIVAMLTINLGIFNLLPLPALDGGRLFFMVIELIRRKPIPPEKEGTVHAVGLLLLLVLAVVICFNDILKLVTG